MTEPPADDAPARVVITDYFTRIARGHPEVGSNASISMIDRDIAARFSRAEAGGASSAPATVSADICPPLVESDPLGRNTYSNAFRKKAVQAVLHFVKDGRGHRYAEVGRKLGFYPDNVRRWVTMKTQTATTRTQTATSQQSWRWRRWG